MGQQHLPTLVPVPRNGAKWELLVLSYGIGQDSTNLLLRWITDPDFRKAYSTNRFLVISSNTGNEDPHTYEYLNIMQGLCEENEIEFHFLVNTMGYHSESWPSLIEFYQRTSTCGSKVFRKTCTANLKVGPIYRFLEKWLGINYKVPAGKKRGFYNFAGQWGKIGVMIGLAREEEKRRGDISKQPVWMQENIEILYPLQDYFGFNRAECQEDIRGMGFEPPYPSSCMICPYTTEVELLWLERFRPDMYQLWIELERNKLEKFADNGKNNYGVFGGDTTLEQVLAKTKELYPNISDKELDVHKFSHGHCVGSKY